MDLDRLVVMIEQAKRMQNRRVIRETPLFLSPTYSDYFGGDVFFKREDLQPIISYKIRGAFNKMLNLSDEEKARGVICSSAGNHAQGVALSSDTLKIHSTIVMPYSTPNNKIEKTKKFGKGFVEVIKHGADFDEANAHANVLAIQNGLAFVHPFDDPFVIAGQGTIGIELLAQLSKIDYVLVPVGGGGLIVGLGAYIKTFSPSTKIIGVEPFGADSMYRSLQNNRRTAIETVNTCAGGVAVKQIGELNFDIGRRVIDDVIRLTEEEIKITVRDLFGELMLVEPSGALAVAALSKLNGELKDKNTVCIISGGNINESTYAEIRKDTLYHGKDHYFQISLDDRPGTLRDLLSGISVDQNNINVVRYNKRDSRYNKPLIGLVFGDEHNLLGVDSFLTQNYVFDTIDRRSIHLESPSELLEDSRPNEHYFQIALPNKPGALLELLERVSLREDNISFFWYNENNESFDRPIIGFEFATDNAYKRFKQEMNDKNYSFNEIRQADLRVR